MLQNTEKIKIIIEDNNLEDAECFLKIEAIIYALEEIGSGGGVRRDFGLDRIKVSPGPGPASKASPEPCI